jgi:hypothetical protein
VATVILNREEKYFWRMTPRKLNELLKVHYRLNGAGPKKGAAKQGFIDQVM